METADELYCLKWNQFQINIFSALEDLHLSEDFADVTLYCDGSSVKAHKVILSACSPYFKTVFMEHPLCSHPVIILKGVSGEDLNSLLTFMYQGEVNIHRERLPEFMKTAKLLQVRGLTNSSSLGVKQLPKRFNDQRKNVSEDSTDSDGSSQSKKRVCIRRNSQESRLTPENNLTPPTPIEVKEEDISIDESFSLNSVKTEENTASPSNETTTNNKNESNECTKDEGGNEESILHRSLKGDHTVKPAESLVVTPDLPIAVNPIIKTEPIDPVAEPLSIFPRKPNSVTSNNIPTSKSHLANPPLTKQSAFISSESKDHATDSSFEAKLSTTLKLLKNNPQISVSREQSNENFVPSSGGHRKLANKSHIFEIQPLISIEPMKICDMNERARSYSNSSNSSILAHNLTKSSTSTKASNNKVSSTPKPSSDNDFNNISGTLSSILQPHTASSSGGLSWNCPHCQQLYHNQSALKYHVRLVHSDFNNRLCCYLCPNSFTMRDSYKAHMLELHGIRH